LGDFLLLPAASPSVPVRNHKGAGFYGYYFATLPQPQCHLFSPPKIYADRDRMATRRPWYMCPPNPRGRDSFPVLCLNPPSELWGQVLRVFLVFLTLRPPGEIPFFSFWRPFRYVLWSRYPLTPFKRLPPVHPSRREVRPGVT